MPLTRNTRTSFPRRRESGCACLRRSLALRVFSRRLSRMDARVRLGRLPRGVGAEEGGAGGDEEGAGEEEEE